MPNTENRVVFQSSRPENFPRPLLAMAPSPYQLVYRDPIQTGRLDGQIDFKADPIKWQRLSCSLDFPVEIVNVCQGCHTSCEGPSTRFSLGAMWEACEFRHSRNFLPTRTAAVRFFFFRTSDDCRFSREDGRIGRYGGFFPFFPAKLGLRWRV